ncbi:TcpQ domain-containing protein [Variovorax sp. KK3]|uniref:TcpQ domain-containing protein n=1 Tax=Variovorax sp. KK3 TaxID=1855728 RepID=UPI00117CAAC3|nr:TcpQ domain-containing protein [Variovorax sp. KK3]
MLKLIPPTAAVVALCACTSAPTLKFPTGSAARQPINASSRPAAVTAPAPAGATASIAATRPMGGPAFAPAAAQTTKAPIASEAPPEPVPLKVFMVNANEQSAMEILRRWARVARVDFSWESDIDYPVTPRMRAIRARELEPALEQMRASLAGVRAPLAITSTPDGLVVQGGVEPSTPEPPPTAAAMPAEPAPSLQVAESRSSWPIGDKKTLREVLDDWTALGGVKLVWESTSTQTLTDAARAQAYGGTFRESVAQLAGTFGELAKPIGMSFLDNGAALRVYDLEVPK